jgi:4-hydroxy-tetrahydrodipicolinate reductase
MKIAIIGYGKMGKEIKKVAEERKHEIVAVIDKDNQADMEFQPFRSAQMAIEFSSPETAFDNVVNCLSLGIPVVCGTTGWLSEMDRVKQLCLTNNGAFFYASNYSLGVNIFFMLNRELARIMEHFDLYNVNIEEIHHTQKKDAPSGTAITLADDIISNITRKTKWLNQTTVNDDEIAIKSVREGSVTGIHTINYESDFDTISIRHEAKNRKAFAFGAIIAAEFLLGKKGIYTMNDILRLKY